MAEINDKLVVEDRFSNILERYIGKTNAAAKAAQAAERTATAGAASASQAVQTAANTAQVYVSGATQELVDRLGILQDAVARSYTQAQRTENLSRLENAMKRCGLVATNAASEGNMAALLSKDSLQDLARAGVITANAVAEASYKEAAAKREAAAAAAAEREAARQAAIEKRAAAAAARAGEAAQRKAAAAARRAAAEAEREAAAARREAEAHQSVVSRIAQHTKELLKNAGAAAQARQSHDVLGNRLLRMGTVMFTARRMLRFLSDSLERAPDGIQKSWSAMTGGIKDTLARGFVSMLGAVQPAMNRFNAFLNSPAGQKLARGVEAAMEKAGQAVGWLLDKITALGTWIGDHFDTVVQVAAIALTAYAANALIAASATAAANLPMILLVGTLAAIVVGLNNAGFTSQEIFTGIGQAAGALYAFVYNLVALGWGMFASVANFVGNVFKDPAASVKILFLDMVSTVLGYIQQLAQGIEGLVNKIPGVSVALTSGIGGLLERAAGKKLEIQGASGWTQYVDPLGYKDYGATANAWGSKAAGLADTFSSNSLAGRTAQYLKNIDQNTGSSANSASKISKDLSDEQMKYIEDVAIRKYERSTNTVLSPTIKVTVNGNADESTGRDIGQAIADILMRQAASHTAITTQEV